MAMSLFLPEGATDRVLVDALTTVKVAACGGRCPLFICPFLFKTEWVRQFFSPLPQIQHVSPRLCEMHNEIFNLTLLLNTILSLQYTRL